MVHNEMSFLFLPRYHQTGNTTQPHVMPMVNAMKSNTKDIYGYIPEGKVRVYKSQNGKDIKNYMNEVIYNSNKSNEDPYISLLNYFTVNNTPSMRLKPADFVYLTDLGVYPINRLIILRRFRDGCIVPNNLTLFKEKPISTVIGWIKAEDNKDLFSLNFNERWVDTTDTLDKVIQKIMKEQFGIKTEMFLPVPGWSQGFLFGMLNNMGLSNYDYTKVPTGDPNVLRKGIMREVEQQSLISELKITFETSYEQKYISDIDPALAFQDIISNLLRMGTSNQSFVINPNSVAFQEFVTAVNSEAPGSTEHWVNFGKRLIEAFVGAVTTFFDDTGQKVSDAYEKQTNKIITESNVDSVDDLAKNAQPIPNQTGKYTYNGKVGTKEVYDTGKKKPDGTHIWSVRFKEDSKQPTSTNELKAGNENITKSVDFVKGFSPLITSFLDTVLAGSIYRYRWPLKGSIGLMSGLNTTPWHLTVGNPFSPILNIGNMVVNNVDLKFSNEMGFNDMPKKVDVAIDIKFGRDLGQQEIEKMFNNQYGRIYSNPADKKAVDYEKDEKGVDKKELVSNSDPQQDNTRTVSTQYNSKTGRPAGTQEIGLGDNSKSVFVPDF